MDKFILVFDENTKEQLLKDGYKLLSSVPSPMGMAYYFENKPEVTKVFAGQQVVFTNILPF